MKKIISADVPGIISARETSFTSMEISKDVSTKQSQEVPNKQTEEPQIGSKREFRTTMPIEESRNPITHQRSSPHGQQLQTVPTFKMASAVQNPVLHTSSLKESDRVTEAGTQVILTEGIVNTPEKQLLISSDGGTDHKRSKDFATQASATTSEEENIQNAIKWVATGKTVVLMKNSQTEKAGHFEC